LSDIFLKSVDLFRKSLDREEDENFTEIASASEMIKSVEEKVSEHPVSQQTRVRTFCLTIQYLSACLAPYFDIIGVFMQANPMFAGTMWGAIHLVFKV
jgi:hypothetical protein